MKYDNPAFESEEATLALVANGSVSEICEAVVGAALYTEDPLWVEVLCLDLARAHQELDVRNVALIGFAHLARRFRRLENPAAVDALLVELGQMPELAGQARDVRDDFESFLEPET